MDRIYDLIVRWPKLILLPIVLLTVFFALQARHIQLDSSIESLLPHDDPEKAYYDEIRLLYGSDEIVVIGLVADTVYTPEALEKIGRITERIREMPLPAGWSHAARIPEIEERILCCESSVLLPNERFRPNIAGARQ